MTFDLASLDTSSASERGASLDVLHPTTGEKLGIAITLAGADSPTYVQAQRAMVNRRIRARGKQVTAEQVEDDAVDLIASCVLGWSGVLVDGKALECTKANAKELLARFPWIKEQCSEFMGERANFLRD